MNLFVVDTSVVVKWFAGVDEPNIKQALQLLDDFEKGRVQLATSDLLIYELGNALLKGKKLPAEIISAALERLYRIGFEIFPADQLIARESAAIAARYGLTFYDAVFAALAKLQGCQLISANPRCHGKIKDGSVLDLAQYRSGSL